MTEDKFSNFLEDGSPRYLTVLDHGV